MFHEAAPEAFRQIYRSSSLHLYTVDKLSRANLRFEDYHKQYPNVLLVLSDQGGLKLAHVGLGKQAMPAVIREIVLERVQCDATRSVCGREIYCTVTLESDRHANLQPE